MPETSEPKRANPMESVVIQQQIRHNASEMQSYYQDLNGWEKAMKKKDHALRQKKLTSVATTTSSAKSIRQPRTTSQGKAPSDHTFDRGYDKWNQFDVEEALDAVDQGEDENRNQALSNQQTKEPTISREPKQVHTNDEIFAFEKERGNASYRKGEFLQAIQSYTRCLGIDAQNIVALSNRAMCYLKLKEYKKAIADTTLALKYDSAHIKSLLRRATARNALGYHRQALLDVQHARELDPKNKQIHSELRKTRESMKNAIKRAPKMKLEISASATTAGPASASQEEPLHEHLSSMSVTSTTADETITTNHEKEDDVGLEPVQVSKKSSPVPNVAPKTSYEFIRIWNALESSGSLQEKAKYLQLIKVSSIPKIFQNSMESSVLFHMIQALTYFSSNSRAFRFLKKLTQVNRFNIALMLLSNEESQEIQSVIDHIEQTSLTDSTSSSIIITTDTVEALRQSYRSTISN